MIDSGYGPDDDAIAQITQNPGFYEKWLEVTNKEELKNLVLLGERKRG